MLFPDAEIPRDAESRYVKLIEQFYLFSFCVQTQYALLINLFERISIMHRELITKIIGISSNMHTHRIRT